MFLKISRDYFLYQWLYFVLYCMILMNELHIAQNAPPGLLEDSEQTPIDGGLEF